MKIHILGGTGSGKTTLAKSLSEKFRVPHYDLDLVGTKHGNRGDELLEEIFTVAEQPGWVSEGVYLIWTDPLLYRADYIVLLDIPWPVAAWRIVWRHVRRSLHGTNPYPGLNGVRGLIRLLQYARGFSVNSLPPDSSAAKSLSKFIEEDRKKESAPEEALLLARLEEYNGGVAPTMEFVRKYLENYQKKVILIKNNADRDRFLALLSQMFDEGEREQAR